MSTLQGSWNYRAFCSLAADPLSTPPRPPMLAAVWTPPTVMTFATDSYGKVTGQAQLGPLHFLIEGAVSPANGVPGRVDLIATVEGGGQPAVYHLQGYFLTGSDHVVGTVVSLGNDPARQPIGTSGPFVMFPTKG